MFEFSHFLSTLHNFHELCQEEASGEKLTPEEQKQVPLSKISDLLRKLNPSITSIDNTYEILEKSSPEYRKICKKIDVKDLKIFSIKKVDNPHIKMLYELKKMDLELQYGKKPLERWMFHGTKDDNAMSICEDNFNWRFSAVLGNSHFGRGTYFSKTFGRTILHTDPCSPYLTVLCCKVLQVKSHKGDQTVWIPKEGYDSTNFGNDNVLVKYHDDTFCPEYLVNFTVTEKLILRILKQEQRRS